jgi:hypothetical protein
VCKPQAGARRRAGFCVTWRAQWRGAERPGAREGRAYYAGRGGRNRELRPPSLVLATSFCRRAPVINQYLQPEPLLVLDRAYRGDGLEVARVLKTALGELRAEMP